MKKIAVVNYHFYKTRTRGGELHVILLSKILQKYGQVTILTTQSKSHLTWKNEIQTKSTEYFEGIEVKRFPTDFTIKPREINNLNQYLYGNKLHTEEEEIEWMKRIGPYSTKLFQYLEDNFNKYDLFFFLWYANPITYFGLPKVASKSVLIPLVRNEPFLYFNLFDKLFTLPKLILASSSAEKKLIQRRFSRHSTMSLLGINVGNEKYVNNRIDISNNLGYSKKPFVFFIGRTEPYKGIFTLIEYFDYFINKNSVDIDLLIAAEKIFPLKTSKNIKYLGPITNTEKHFLLQKCLFLINPSWYEASSLVLLEAWLYQKPVLVNGFCNALKGQVIQSNGGLYYKNYQEFEKMFQLLFTDIKLRDKLGRNGNIFYKKFYQEKIISKRYGDIVENFPI